MIRERVFDNFALIAWALSALKLFASALMPTPRATLIRDAKLFAWCTLPLLLAQGLAYLGNVYDRYLYTWYVVLFATVFAGLVAGNLLRKVLRPDWPSPQPTSLPLAALVVSGLLAVVLNVGDALNPLGGISCRYIRQLDATHLFVQDLFPFGCHLFYNQGVYAASFCLVLAAVIGFSLSSQSNVIVLYDNLLRRFKRQPSADQPSQSPAASVGAIVVDKDIT